MFFVLTRSSICYYIIFMIVPLVLDLINPKCNVKSEAEFVTTRKMQGKFSGNLATADKKDKQQTFFSFCNVFS